jgi:hypothetical protein
MQCQCVETDALRGALVLALAEWPTGIALRAEQPRGSQTPALSERAEIAPDGVTVRYPTGWSISQEPHAARLVHMQAERVASANAQTFNSIAQILITVEKFGSYDEAVKRLENIRAESAPLSPLLRCSC